jgi:MiaB/RimO family radical SAM methylthiotransferase
VAEKQRVHIRSNGCPGQELDVSRLTRYFECNGYTYTARPKKADVIVFLTCCAIESRQQSSLARIRRYRETKADLIVGGCLPDIAPTEFEQVHASKGGKYIHTRNVDKIDEYFPQFKIKYKDVPEPNFIFPKRSMIAEKALSEFEFSRRFFNLALASGVLDRKKMKTPYLRIGRGCNEQCAYCGIRKAIGPHVSKPIETCLEEYQSLLDQGHRSFKIHSDNTGSYGVDIGSSLSELLTKLVELHQGLSVEWFIVHLEPVWAIKQKEALQAWIGEKLITEILYPVQSGNDRVLRAMRRSCKSEAVMQCLKDFRSANEDLEVYTQFIVGFPSETEQEFLETLDFIRAANFNLVMPFRYYDAPSCTAYELEGKLDEATIEDRFKRACRAFDEWGISWVEL